MRGHHGDLDDIHWPTLTHPGSVVWPVVLGIAAVAPTPGVEVARAASAGYDMTAAVADVIAASGVTGIHRTSVAGHAGAAIAAALLLGDGGDATDAVGLALAVAGGVGQTIDERAAAGGFHRASAAVAGVHARARGTIGNERSVAGARGSARTRRHARRCESRGGRPRPGGRRRHVPAGPPHERLPASGVRGRRSARRSRPRRAGRDRGRAAPGGDRCARRPLAALDHRLAPAGLGRSHDGRRRPPVHGRGGRRGARGGARPGPRRGGR